MKTPATQTAAEALVAFAFAGEYSTHSPYGSGHINDTFLVVCVQNGTTHRYILQRINHYIFKNPQELMENISMVTSFLQEQIIARGGNPARESLTLVPTRMGALYYVDSTGYYWRAYLFIEDSICLDKVEKPNHFYQSAVSFGNFQRLLATFPAHTLHETIANFHNTPARFEALLRAVATNACGLAKTVQPEIAFVQARKQACAVLATLQSTGALPLRVTHNDTKLNNIMLDQTTEKGICVIDLDTVMPGLSVHDFGDSIRFGASTGAEDEQDLTKVSLSLPLFELFTQGFLEGCGGSLTQKELEMLPMGAKLMTLECGIRFLTDHLEGDTYFKTHYPAQNLARARAQFKLVADMEQKWEEMYRIVATAAHNNTTQVF